MEILAMTVHSLAAGRWIRQETLQQLELHAMERSKCRIEPQKESVTA
jgi:hypothetical protein